MFEVEPTRWKAIQTTIDFLFFVDMILIFNSAFYDDDFKVVDKRKTIAVTYLKSWFFVDLLAMLPFDLILQREYQDIVRIVRLGRLSKLSKLCKLVRVFRVMKSKPKVIVLMSDLLKIRLGF